MMNDEKYFEGLIRDLELLGLVRVEGGKVIVDLQSTIDFIATSIALILGVQGGSDILRAIFSLSDEDVLGFLFTHGIVTKSSVLMRRITGKSIIEEDYIIDLICTYLTIIKSMGIYGVLIDRIRELRSVIC